MLTSKLSWFTVVDGTRSVDKAFHAVIRWFESCRRYVHEALILLYQICGASHRDTAVCYQTLAQILAHSNDPAAVTHQQRAVILFTKLSGADHLDTASALAHLGIYQVGFSCMMHSRTTLVSISNPSRDNVVLLRGTGVSFCLTAPFWRRQKCS